MPESFFALEPRPKVLGLAIGVFDGVHLGHQALVRELARQEGRATVALTFEPHPAALVHPDKAPPRLSTAAQRSYLLQVAGAGDVVTLHFDEALRALSAEEFLTALHRLFPNLKRVAVGPDWRFGHDRAGNAAMMAEYGGRHGFIVETMPVLEKAGGPVRSTRIREAIAAHDFPLAAALLGREYALDGHVVSGAGRGTGIGFPTANVGGITQMLPPPGVYACRAAVPDGVFRAVANYGSRPTFEKDGKPVLEVHLLGYAGELEGSPIAVGTFRRLRGEKKFANVEELKAQILEDIARADEEAI
ncbi:MAG: riboflavin biosynthesis protein RibF [Verrucomicrobium sp.]|nr:riboflavin biosynthesis protein RibF [Verrucomicrobium sp.]